MGGSIEGVGPPEEGGGSLAPPLSESRGAPAGDNILKAWIYK